MDRIRRSDLDQLVAPRPGPCVSLFMPMHPAGRDGMEDPVRLRKLTDDAEEALIERGMRRPDATRLLEPARRLPGDELAWQHRGRSLAMFLAPGFVRTYHGNGEIESAVVVNDQFHLRLLLPLVTDEDRFFVLALSQNAVRLLEGNLNELRELTVADLPRHPSEIANIDEGTAGKGDQRLYLRHVAAVIDKRLNGERAPLVLATVAANMPLWREASQYSHTLEEFVAGSPDHLAPHELHAKAWPIVQPALASRRELLRQQIFETKRAGLGLREVVRAAIRGQVAALFIDCKRERWGRYDPAHDAVEVHSQREPGDQDLVELAAVETLRHSGEVFPLQPQNAATGEAVEALLRF
jgi:hypothetical protein